jgi:hypothetical protein
LEPFSLGFSTLNKLIPSKTLTLGLGLDQERRGHEGEEGDGSKGLHDYLADWTAEE